MAVEAGHSSTGTIKTDLRENAVGLPGILMQGIATIKGARADSSMILILAQKASCSPWCQPWSGLDW